MTYAIHVNLYAIALLVIIMISLAKTKHLKSMNNVYYRPDFCISNSVNRQSGSLKPNRRFFVCCVKMFLLCSECSLNTQP